MVQALDDERPRRPRTGNPARGAGEASTGAGGAGLAAIGGRQPRVPPHDLDAEESLLGAMLLSSDAVAVAVETCSPGDFYKPAHGHIFSAILSLFEAGEPVDAVTVADELKRRGLLEQVGDPTVLVSLQVNTPSLANAGHYARIVEEHALLRRLIGVAGELAELGYAVPDDVTATIDEAERLVFDLSERRTADSVEALRNLIGPSLDRIEELSHRSTRITGVATGYSELDDVLAGLQPASLTIVGARPAMGKTSFALGMLAHVGTVLHRPALLFSLEMGHLELTQRLLASEARVDSQRMRTGHLHDSDWAKVGAAVSRLSESTIFIDENPHLTVMDIRARARRLKKSEGDLGLVVVDYLQLMTGRSKAENRQVEVSEISRGLKILARELECPVVALSQLSRNLEARQDKRPMLSDLRESGCMPASTRLLRADTGGAVPLGELVLTQEQPLVWSLDDRTWKLVPRRLVKAFPSGLKPVYRLRLRAGCEVEATANHRFRCVEGWRRLDEIGIGDWLAVPSPTGEWLAPGGSLPEGRPGARRCAGSLSGAPLASSAPRADLPVVVPRGAASGMRHTRPGRRTAEWRARGEVTCWETGPRSRASSDVLWDEVVAISPAGVQPTFDATVEWTHNFIANGVVAHNSLEQDADVVLFIFREELYDPDTPIDRRGLAEIIVAKHRNGPTGSAHLVFLGQYARFDNLQQL
jgi:replicative DNA helicase